MNFILNLLLVIITGAFVIFGLVNLILNVIRGNKANAVVKQDPKYVDGTVTAVIHSRGKVYVKVEYRSINNNSKFANYFTFNEKKFNDKYVEGQAVRVMYPNTANMDKVLSFPIYLEGEPIKLDPAGLFLDIFLIIAGVYLFAVTLIAVLTPDESTKLIGLEWNGRPFMDATASWDGNNNSAACFQSLYIIIYFVFYIFLGSYVYERMTGLPADQKQEYLKLCGIKGKAEVKTFKLAGRKNERGFKESQMKVEFFTNDGQKIECDLNSYLYTETQEQYINILYDPKHPKNVVYLKEGSKKEESKEVE